MGAKRNAISMVLLPEHCGYLPGLVYLVCFHNCVRACDCSYLPSLGVHSIPKFAYLKNREGVGGSLLIQCLTASCWWTLLLSNSRGMCACVLLMFCHMSFTASVTHLYLGLPTLRFGGSRVPICYHDLCRVWCAALGVSHSSCLLKFIFWSDCLNNKLRMGQLV